MIGNEELHAGPCEVCSDRCFCEKRERGAESLKTGGLTFLRKYVGYDST